MLKLLIIADDFTGALDTGVQFAAYGAKTLVETNTAYEFTSVPEEVQVLVLDAETRPLSPTQAYEVISGIVNRALIAGVPYIYKKTDSALRGNIGAELSAVLDASPISKLVFVPAFPIMNRITRGGIHYIDGVPVAETAFGCDPYEPVKISDVGAIIRSQTKVETILHTMAETADGEGIHIFDANSDKDLYDIAETVGLQSLQLTAGCAGFASVLANILELNGPRPQAPSLNALLFVVCGSVNPITKKQLEYAVNRGFPCISLDLMQKLDTTWVERPEFKATIRKWAALTQSHGRCILETNDVSGDLQTLEFATNHGLTPAQVRQQISYVLGSITRGLLELNLEATFLCTGGDTLLGLMNALNVDALYPICEIAPGVVLSSFFYQENQHHIISKSGGFGDEDLIYKLSEQLIEHAKEGVYGKILQSKNA